MTGRNGSGCARTVANRAEIALTGAVRTGLYTLIVTVSGGCLYVKISIDAGRGG